MKKVILFIFLVLFCIGCAPKQFEPFQPPEIKFEKTEEYKLDLSSIKKPEKINPIFVDENFKEVPTENARFVLLSQQEYAKVGSLVELAITYKKVAEGQATLINLHINTINSLKEFLELERQKSLQYRELWVNAENNYRYEQWEHKKDSFFYQSGLYAISLGSLIGLFALAL